MPEKQALMHLTSPNFTSDISSDSPDCALCTFKSYDHCHLWRSILWERDHSVETASLAILTSSRVMLRRAMEVPHDLSRSSYRERVKFCMGVQSKAGVLTRYVHREGSLLHVLQREVRV